MALAKYGDGITNMVGTFGGNYHTRDKSGAHIAAQPRIIRRPHSTLRSMQTNAFRKCIVAWKHNLPSANIPLWAQFARTLPTVSRLGEKITLTAWQAFLHINLIRARNNLTLTTIPPTE